ncbi:MAG: DinB family protein [Candidatus Limnocylindrales bacterium]
MSYDERADLLSAYAAAPPAIRALLRGAETGAVERSPGGEDWNVRQVLDHLAVSAEGMAKRLARIASEDRPDLVPFDDSGSDPMPVDEALTRFETARSQEMAVLTGADDGGWDRIGIHPAHGEISIRDIVRHMSSHDLEHIGQIGRSLTG